VRPGGNGLVCSPAAAHEVRQRLQVAAASATLDDLSASTADSTEGEAQPSSAPAAGSSQLDDVPLTSEAGRDYAALRDSLKEGDFQKADDITRDELIQLAGPGAVKRNWVYFSEVKFIPEQDLQTIDALWKAASGGKFGYSVQKEVWMQQSKYWSRFFKKIDWTQGENNNYRKWPMEFMYTTEAPKGHLPLTNALRGTQLIQAIFEHPAFERKGAGGSSNGAPSWMQ
jgi:hypothetical protein